MLIVHKRHFQRQERELYGQKPTKMEKEVKKNVVLCWFKFKTILCNSLFAELFFKSHNLPKFR